MGGVKWAVAEGGGTYGCRGSPRALRGRVASSVVHDVGAAGAAADYLTAGHVHAHAAAASTAGPAPVVGHAVRGDHGGHLRRAALRVEVAPAAVLAVQLRLRVRVGSSVRMGGGGRMGKVGWGSGESGEVGRNCYIKLVTVLALLSLTFILFLSAAAVLQSSGVLCFSA